MKYGESGCEMRERDIVFLRDFVTFGYLHHGIAALAYLRAEGAAQEVASDLYMRTEGLSQHDAQQRVQAANDGSRVEKITAARLLSEFVAAQEDLGALCAAIYHRSGAGILRAYTHNDGRTINPFFDRVVAHVTDDLGTLLRLPPLTELVLTLPPERYAEVREAYTAYADNLRDVALKYRQIQRQATTFTTPTAAPAATLDDCNILLDMVEPGEQIGGQGKALATLAYNRIKHRFMVIDDLAAFSGISDMPQQVAVAFYSRTAESIDGLTGAIMQTIVLARQLGLLLLLLDEEGALT